MSRRAKQILGTVATVVVLAGVMFGGWALSAPKRQTTPPTITFTPQQESDRAYQQGLAAERSGDTTAAVAAFTAAIKLSPNNSAAKDALEKAKQSQSASTTKTSKGSSSTGESTTTPAGVDPFQGKTAQITSLVPTTYPGFSLGAPIGDSSSVTLAGAKAGPGGGITHIQWSVYDRETASGASSFIKKVTKPLFGKSTASVQVHGLPATFGTDGIRLAAVYYSRGQYVFEVVLTARTLSTAKASAVQAAGAFAAHP